MLVFFFNDTATTEIYTLSLHDALPISVRCPGMRHTAARLDLVRRLRAEPAEPVLRVRQRRGELRAGDRGGRGGILRHARAVRARPGRSRLAAPRHGEGARPLLPYGGRRDGSVPGRELADVR